MFEVLGYLLSTFGVWVFSYFFLVKDAYEYLQLEKPKEERTYMGDDLNPEGTENIPTGF